MTTDESKGKRMKTEKVTSIDDLFAKISSLEKDGKWIFRGEREASWIELKTSFDRMIEDSDISSGKAQEVEIALIKKFQRDAHYYGVTGIDYLNIPEWISIMQHYGAPTRLQDWTHSPWVALFFAIVDKSKADTSYAGLLALDWKQLDDSTDPKIKSIYKSDFNFIKIDDFVQALSVGPGVIKLNSYRQNERQIIQQGTFLFPLDISRTFWENLEATRKANIVEVIKYEISPALKSEIIQRLFRMNITYSTLYPGIVGFSTSLKNYHHMPGLLNIEENIRYHGYEKLKDKFQI